MTSEIKFRGKRLSDDEWVYGGYFNDNGSHFIPQGIGSAFVEVDPKTVGQYTGFKDKNKKEMYEGDIANLASEDTEPFMRNIPLVVRRYPDGQFLLVDRLGCRDFLITNIVEVIGNIHDNPELLEVK